MLFEAFRRNRTDRPDAAAFLVSTGDRALPITWRKFTDDIDAVAFILRSYAPGSTVGILGENSYEWMVVHAAILFSGACAMPIDANLTAVEIAERLRFVHASAFVYSSLYEEKAHAVAQLCPGVAKGAFGSRKTDGYVAEARQRIFELPTESIWLQNALSFSPSDQTSMLVWTSGTTSQPRAVELTLAGLETFCRAWSEALKMKPGQRSLMLLPLQHIFGVCSTYLMLGEGVELGVCADFHRLYDAFKRFRANFAFLVPALADILARRIQQRGGTVEKALGQPIDWLLCGGAPLSRGVYEHLRVLGVKVITAYGLTETTALYSVTPSDGDPHVSLQGRVATADATESRVSPEGELLLRGPSVMKGYYRMPERTASAIDGDGWFHTGDIGEIDSEGFVKVVGRASRTIVLSSGKKVAPEELEEKLLCLPGVREALVTGNAETRELCAEIYSTLAEETVRKSVGQLNMTLPVYMRVNRLRFRSTPFARTASGKIIVAAKDSEEFGVKGAEFRNS